jgi:hypothetical protein
MVTQFDEKGKIFTEVISKQPVQVTIYTGQQVIQGFIYIRTGTRLKDEVNGQERFLAITDAVVSDTQKNEIYRTGFMVVNIDHIVWIMPLQDLSAQ